MAAEQIELLRRVRSHQHRAGCEPAGKLAKAHVKLRRHALGRTVFKLGICEGIDPDEVDRAIADLGIALDDRRKADGTRLAPQGDIEALVDTGGPRDDLVRRRAVDRVD